MCGKVSGGQSQPENCVFDDPKGLQEIITLAEMSLIKGFRDYLFDEWCTSDAYRWRYLGVAMWGIQTF